jgi:hypothetical protein
MKQVECVVDNMRRKLNIKSGEEMTPQLKGKVKGQS